MDSILALTIHPEIYTITMFILLGISCRTLFLYFLGRYENQISSENQSFTSRTLQRHDVQSGLLYNHPLTSWLTLLIKRKDSPPDDEDHHYLLIPTHIAIY